MGLALFSCHHIILRGFEESDLATYVGDGETSASLPAGNAAQTGLVLDDAIGNSHLAAEGREEENELEIVERNY